MQSSAQEVTMLSKLIAAAKDSWACFICQAKFKLILDLETIAPASWSPHDYNAT